jgi:hypothetical protein
MYTDEWADKANARRNSQSDMYRYTTEPINNVNDTLKEIKALLIEIRNLLQDGK